MYLPAVPSASAPQLCQNLGHAWTARVPHIEAIPRNFGGICPAEEQYMPSEAGAYAGILAFMNHMNGSALSVHLAAADWALRCIPLQAPETPHHTISYHTTT